MAEEPLNVEHESGASQDGESPETVAVDIESAAFAELTWEEQVASLRDILQASRNQTAQNLDLAQRAQAEMANQRRRSDEERISQGRYSNSRLIAKLLPVVEELALAMGHVEATNGMETPGGPSQKPDPSAQLSPQPSWLEGVRLIQRKLMILLESEGVTPIDAVGGPFNPLEHEALGTDESSDYPPGHVIKAVRQGYRLHDRIIQPAQVIVAREPQIEPQDVGTGNTSSEVKETDNG